MTVLLLVRHGETDWLGERLAGRLPDVHLNAEGRAKAETIAAMLKPIPLAAVYSSPLERTMETAEPTARAVGKEIVASEFLLEMDFGELTGKSFTELREIPHWQEVHRRPSDVQFPGGESPEEAQRRTVRGLHEIHAEYESGIVAVFTHADTIRLALAHYLHMPLAAYYSLVTDPGSVSIIYVHRKAVRVAGINIPAGSPIRIIPE